MHLLKTTTDRNTVFYPHYIVLSQPRVIHFVKIQYSIVGLYLISKPFRNDTTNVVLDINGLEEEQLEEKVLLINFVGNTSGYVLLLRDKCLLFTNC